MKNKWTVIVFLAVLMTALNCKAQNFEERLVKTQLSCEQIALRSSELFPYYMESGMMDSAGMLLTFWNEKCGNTEPVYRANLLMVLQMHYFNEDMVDNYFLQRLNAYEYRLNTINYQQLYIYNYNLSGFDYVPVGGVFDIWTKRMATDLLEYYQPGDVEYLICLFYSGQTELAYTLINQEPYASTAPGIIYATKLDEALRLPMYSMSFYASTWIPDGQLSAIGVHPEIGMSYGIKFKENSFDLVFGIKFINAPKPYKALRTKNDEPEFTNYFFGGYIGIEYSRDLYNFSPFQTYFTAGAGFDGFNMLEEDKDAGLELSSANSYNLNLGVGMRLLLYNNNYLNMAVRYNLLDYTLNDKFFMKGNVYTIRLSYQFMGNVDRQNLLNALHYSY